MKVSSSRESDPKIEDSGLLALILAIPEALLWLSRFILSVFSFSLSLSRSPFSAPPSSLTQSFLNPTPCQINGQF